MAEQAKKKVILITDGDNAARQAVEKVAQKVGGRCISLSAGSPTPLAGEEIIAYIMATPYDPVLVMLDDRGDRGRARGETALAQIVNSDQVEVLGVVAVAANTDYVRGIKVDCSVTRDGELIRQAVDKDGYPRIDNSQRLEGDTVDVLNELDVPLIVGVGDVGKMKGSDCINKGAPITVRAVEEILLRSGYQV